MSRAQSDARLLRVAPGIGSLYRIATYYAPLWGFPAMLWLQRNQYL